VSNVPGGRDWEVVASSSGGALRWLCHRNALLLVLSTTNMHDVSSHLLVA
jgi:hypothetical protein